jgi:hypothetical protein
VHRFSSSRGLDTDDGHRYEPKGFVPEEFLVLPAPGAAEHVTVRTLMRVDEPGEYLLTVAAPAATRVWLDGTELAGTDDRFATTVPVRFADRVAVLEYRVGASELPASVHGHRPDTVPSWFMLERAGTHVERPEFISPSAVSGGEGDLRTRFDAPHDAESVTVVVGSTAAVRVELDGALVARQEKVQYYESDAGDRPMFFTHRLGALPAGEHELRVVAETADPAHAVSVDAVIDGTGGLQAVVSGPHWTTGASGAGVRVVRGLGAGLTHTHAARRPHPLPGTSWLAGEPELGEPAVRFSAARSTEPRGQELEVVLPAGTLEAELPVPVERAELGSATVVVERGRLVLDRPLERPTPLVVRTTPRAFDAGGAVWDGPAVVRTGPFSAPFGDWQDLGLGSWSGAVRSTRSITVAEGERLRLDLGHVRGAVLVAVDGREVGALFCSPFALDLGELTSGEHELTVTVYGTLAPRLDSISPTPFLRPSQLRTGVLGPVRLVRWAAGR